MKGYRASEKSYGHIVEVNERHGAPWRKHKNDGPYKSRESAQSRVRALRKIDAERPDDLAARIMASRQFCAI